MSNSAGAFARLHPVLGLVPGLFLSRSRSAKPNAVGARLLGSQTYTGAEYAFEGPAPLGVHDLRVLQAVFMLASRPDNALEMEVGAPQSQLTAALAGGLAFKATAPGAPTRAKVVAASVSAIAAAGGYSAGAGGGRRNVPAALGRLAAITVVCRDGDAEQVRSRLLAWSEMDPAQAGFGVASDTLAVAVAPALSTPLLKGAKGGFIRLPQSEIDSLGDDPKAACARILHLRLCAIVNHGERKGLSAATLAEYAFGPAATAATARRQYQDARDALELFRPLGWTVEADARRGGAKLFTVGRPALPGKGGPKA